jgi:hypothetical protein
MNRSKTGQQDKGVKRRTRRDAAAKPARVAEGVRRVDGAAGVKLTGKEYE